MAKVFPSGWTELTAMGAAERELQTLAELAAVIRDNFPVSPGHTLIICEAPRRFIFRCHRRRVHGDAGSAG